MGYITELKHKCKTKLQIANSNKLFESLVSCIYVDTLKINNVYSTEDLKEEFALEISSIFNKYIKYSVTRRYFYVFLSTFNLYTKLTEENDHLAIFLYFMENIMRTVLPENEYDKQLLYCYLPYSLTRVNDYTVSKEDIIQALSWIEDDEANTCANKNILFPSMNSLFTSMYLSSRVENYLSGKIFHPVTCNVSLFNDGIVNLSDLLYPSIDFTVYSTRILWRIILLFKHCDCCLLNDKNSITLSNIKNKLNTFNYDLIMRLFIDKLIEEIYLNPNIDKNCYVLYLKYVQAIDRNYRIKDLIYLYVRILKKFSDYETNIKFDLTDSNSISYDSPDICKLIDISLITREFRLYEINTPEDDAMIAKCNSGPTEKGQLHRCAYCFNEASENVFRFCVGGDIEINGEIKRVNCPGYMCKECATMHIDSIKSKPFILCLYCNRKYFAKTLNITIYELSYKSLIKLTRKIDGIMYNYHNFFNVAMRTN